MHIWHIIVASTVGNLIKKLSRGTIHKNAWVKFQNINKWIPQIFAYSSVVNDFELVFDF